MYKRLFKEESESPSTPTKKANTSQPRLVISSPNKGIYDNTTTTFVRDIKDPDDMSLLAVTFEGIYDLRMFFQGHSTILDDSGEQVKCPVTGYVASSCQTLTILTTLTGVSVYEDMIVETLADRMGVQGFIPQFLQVFKPAGINNKTGERGKRYIFLVPVGVAGNTPEAVDNVKQLINGLHNTHYKNENGYDRKISIVTLAAQKLSSKKEAQALYHFSQVVQSKWTDSDVADHASRHGVYIKTEGVRIKSEPDVGAAGGGGSLAKELAETSDGGKRLGDNEDNEDAPFPALAGGNSSSSSSSEGAQAPYTAGKKGRGNKANFEAK